MIQNTKPKLKLANDSLFICAKFKNEGAIIQCASLTVPFSHRKFVTIALTHRKSQIKRHPEARVGPVRK